MVRIGLVGGRGYVGAELLRLLDADPDFEIAFVGSSSQAGESVGDLLETPLQNDIRFRPLDIASMRATGVDAWILAQPNGHAAGWVRDLDSEHIKFLDISYDHRFAGEWVYGLPEKNRGLIRGADRVANPGCYATATQLALLPIVDRIAEIPVAFGVSGYSGAGRTPSPRNDPQRLHDNLIPYSLIDHGHQLEISHQLNLPVRFIPHVAQFFRGISVTVDIVLKQASDSKSIKETYLQYYESDKLINVLADIPEIRQIVSQPNAMIGGFALDETGTRLAIVCVIDNLLKGAASQAMQNLRLMFGL